MKRFYYRHRHRHRHKIKNSRYCIGYYRSIYYNKYNIHRITFNIDRISANRNGILILKTR